MKVVKVKRETKTENYYSQNMGKLTSKVTYINKYILGIPIKTIHKYRETYYGRVKDCMDCRLHI